MDHPPPSDREPSLGLEVYEKAKRRLMRETRLTLIWALVGAVVVTGAYYFVRPMEVPGWTNLGLLIYWLLGTVEFFALLYLISGVGAYRHVVQQLAQAQAIQAAVRQNPHVPYCMVAHQAGKRVQWRVLCQSGAVMAGCVIGFFGADFFGAKTHFGGTAPVGELQFAVNLTLGCLAVCAMMIFTLAGGRFMSFAKAARRVGESLADKRD